MKRHEAHEGHEMTRRTRRERARVISATTMATALVLYSVVVAASAALKFEVPPGWIAKPAASTMRVAEYGLPRVAGDSEDASVVVYYFGGQGGSVQANLDRWIGQMTQPDGRASKDVAKTSTLVSAGGLKVTVIDVPGTYVAEVAPGSAERHNKPGFHLRAAVIETTEGPYFVKITGPAKTVAKWSDSLGAFLKSAKTG